MTQEEYRAFLSAGTRTGKLATVRSDGRPHVVPIWFLLDEDDTIVFTTWHATVKAANLRRDPRVSMCVDREAPPYDYVRVDGAVAITEHPDPREHLRWTTRIAERYMGPELADQYGRRNAVEGELLVRITPTKVTALKNIAA